MLGHGHLVDSHLHEDHLDDGHDLGVDGVINTVVNPEDGEVPGEVQECLQDNEEDSSVFDQEEVLSDSEDYDDVIDTSTVKRVQMIMQQQMNNLSSNGAATMGKALKNENPSDKGLNDNESSAESKICTSTVNKKDLEMQHSSSYGSGLPSYFLQKQLNVNVTIANDFFHEVAKGDILAV